MKPRLLDLFCGAGGAAVGYHRAGFEVVGVDIKTQPNFPFEFIQADALTFPLDGFDAYHASPPCQAFTDNNITRETNHPDLIEPTRTLLVATGQPFVIENVQGAPIIASLLLCGTMFGLHVIRHRYFEMNIAPPMSPFSCNHWGTVINADFAPVYGRGSKGRRYIEVDEHGVRVRKRIGRGKPPPNGLSFKEWFRNAMGIDWMQNIKELTESIPPAYTEYIGKYLMDQIRRL